ncbi:MAG: DUF4097 family beta strand repeat protein [Ignavibacteriae bacterium]|nr:DUF4097 family beta strand repeat protein [Ignavibacteriota bacterium]
MKNVIVSLLMLIAIPSLTVQSEELTEKLEIRRSLKFINANDANNSLLVDNINGSIEVTGYDGDVVELVVHETITAESKRKIEEAKQKVRVDIEEEGDRILLFVDAPWRCEDGSTNYRGYDYYGYEVECDFVLKVPRKVDIRLKTINDGTIKVTNVEGAFVVENVNGDVRLRDVSGSGKARTVDGDVEVSFKKNPTEESSFKTINGEVTVRLQENLSAVLEFKTMNGEVYSDFDVQSLPLKSPTMKRRNGMKVYRSGDSFSVRVGSGGPELSFDTLNGDIYVSKYE